MEAELVVEELERGGYRGMIVGTSFYVNFSLYLLSAHNNESMGL